MRGLLFKLQAIFDLPKRLHTALEQGAVEIAVNAFADAAPLLKRYGHKVMTVDIPMIRKVYQTHDSHDWSQSHTCKYV